MVDATLKPVGAERPHLAAIDSFRGLAILLIIAGHVIGLSRLHVDTFPEKVLVNLVIGGTSLFVFISGFLFQHLLPRGFSYRRFLLQKAEYVLLPYLVMSAIPVTYLAVRALQRMPSDGTTTLACIIEKLGSFVGHVVASLSTGLFLNGYWYVPFILTMFLLAPVFLRYTRLALPSRLAIMGAAILVALLVHRPVHNVSVLQSVVYFTPFYLLGINVSIDRERVLRHLAGREWLLGIGMLGLSVIQVASFPDYRNMHKPALAWGGMDLNLPQKMLACLVFYSLFSRVERLNQPFLKTLATASFALFFLHAPVIEIFTRLTAQEWLRSLCGRLPGSIVWVFWILVVTTLSYGIAVVIRQLLPGQSRRVIGW